MTKTETYQETIARHAGYQAREAADAAKVAAFLKNVARYIPRKEA